MLADIVTEAFGRPALMREARRGWCPRCSRPEAACEQLLVGDSDDVEALLLQGLALAAARRPQEAATVLNRVAASRPPYAHPCADLIAGCTGLCRAVAGLPGTCATQYTPVAIVGG